MNRTRARDLSQVRDKLYRYLEHGEKRAVLCISASILFAFFDDLLRLDEVVSCQRVFISANSSIRHTEVILTDKHGSMYGR